MIDAALGGVWAACMKFNLLPSVLILSMMSMNNVAAGGTACCCAAWAGTWQARWPGTLAFGAAWHPER
ncbi:MASE2 domain-containing protein [Cupriavidus basilensis]